MNQFQSQAQPVQNYNQGFGNLPPHPSSSLHIPQSPSGAPTTIGGATEKEHILGELRLHYNFLDDSLEAILNTLIFVRAPTVLKPKDRSCERLAPLIYSTCGVPTVDESIRSTVDVVKNSFKVHFRSNPIITGYNTSPFRFDILISFYEKKEIREWAGLVTRSENSYFEHWRIPMSLYDLPFAPNGNAVTEGHDFNSQYQTAYEHVTKAIVSVIEVCGSKLSVFCLFYLLIICTLSDGEPTYRPYSTHHI
jgi:hypothetical protein